MDCLNVFETLVTKTANYIAAHELKCMVLGISGGIDSTVVAAICYEASKKIGVPFIGRSLPILNKDDEKGTAELVGNAFCTDFKVVPLRELFDMCNFFNKHEDFALTPIAKGNLQARFRMMYLYNIAGIRHGIVMDTDNLTEHYLGFWTIHGDEGDLNPIGHLWKTQVYELAKYLEERYSLEGEQDKSDAIKASIGLTPTDGLGISNSDLEQIGMDNYEQVDEILQYLVENDKAPDLLMSDGAKKVSNRYYNSAYKRKQRPIVL
jgi:NAD+ synthetase